MRAGRWEGGVLTRRRWAHLTPNVVRLLTPDYDPSEEYPGTAPFSEPEAELLRTLAAAFKLHVWLR